MSFVPLEAELVELARSAHPGTPEFHRTRARREVHLGRAGRLRRSRVPQRHGRARSADRVRAQRRRVDRQGVRLLGRVRERNDDGRESRPPRRSQPPCRLPMVAVALANVLRHPQPPLSAVAVLEGNPRTSPSLNLVTHAEPARTDEPVYVPVGGDGAFQHRPRSPRDPHPCLVNQHEKPRPRTWTKSSCDARRATV